MIGRSIWEIDMGDRYGRSEINEISIGILIWNMGYRYGIWYIDMVIYHIDMVILNIDMGDEANDMGDDRIDKVISHIDMGYLVTLSAGPYSRDEADLYNSTAFRTHAYGRAVQVDPIKPTLKPPGSKRLKLAREKSLSNLAFKINLRHYSMG
jgi:hypothetical protein